MYSPKIRILIVEEVRAIREMIATALTSQPDMEVVGQVSQLDEIVVAITRCDVVLINLMHRGVFSPSGWNLRVPVAGVKFVGLGGSSISGLTPRSNETKLDGYVARDASLAELLQTVRMVCHATSMASPSLLLEKTDVSVESISPIQIEPISSSILQSLTRREREVFTLIQQGLTNQEIARFLVIELGTVKNHVHRILRKLNLASRRDTLHLARVERYYPRLEPVAAGFAQGY